MEQKICDIVLSGPTEGEDWDQHYSSRWTHAAIAVERITAVHNATINPIKHTRVFGEYVCAAGLHVGRKSILKPKSYI